jgi:YggT family protein
MLFLINAIDKLFLIYMIMIFIRIFSSWFPDYRDSTVVRFVSYYTDPYLNVFRNIIPPLGMFDLSPIVAILALQVIQSVIKSLLLRLFA